MIHSNSTMSICEMNAPKVIEPFRIVTWNCAGKLREKYTLLQSLKADICIVQECENPVASRHKGYREFAANALWTGDVHYKGLGVFAREGISLSLLDWEAFCLRHFLPVRVNEQWNLLAVWAAKPYIEEYYVYHSIHRDKIDSHTVVAGDFNSNQRWDRKHNKRSHSAVAQMLADAGLVSAYHQVKGEMHGQESEPTFFLYRNPERPYHIDYAFAAPDAILDCRIEQDSVWVCSDHRPLIIDLNL